MRMMVPTQAELNKTPFNPSIPMSTAFVNAPTADLIIVVEDRTKFTNNNRMLLTLNFCAKQTPQVSDLAPMYEQLI